jgi:replicative DNA helicase
MNDLKNAGALTEVSDIVLGIHRPYYNPELSIKTKLKESIASHDNLFMEEESNNAQFIQEDMNKNIAEVIILKQRMGENNTLVNFVFNPETTCFETITAEYQRTINMNKTDLLTGA